MKVSKFLSALILFGSLAIKSNGWAQKQNAVLDEVSLNGITNTFITAIFQDSKGYMWLGTIAGLNRYDGYNFTNYRSFMNDSTSLSSPQVNCMVELKDKRVLVGTSKGLSIYSQASNSFKRVFVPGNAKEESYLLRQRIRCLFTTRDGQILCGTSSGVYVFNELNNTLLPLMYGKETYLNNWVVQSIMQDRGGAIWFGAKKQQGDEVIFRVFKLNLNTLSQKELVVSNGGSSGHLGISEDYLGNIWVSTDDGLVSINPSSLKQTFYKSPENFYSNSSYYHSKDNVIWQGFWSFGVTAFDIDKKQFTVYKNDPTNPRSLNSNKVYSLFKDDNEIMWFGSDVGLQKLTSKRPNLEIISGNFDPSHPFISNRFNRVELLAKHPEKILIAIDGEGFSILDKSLKLNTFFGPQGAIKNDERFVNDFYEDEDGTVFIGGQNNFSKLTFVNDKPVTKSYFDYQKHYVFSILPDKLNKDILWLLGINQIIKFDKRTEQFIFINKPGGLEQLFHNGFMDKETLYLLHKDGILKYNTLTAETEDIVINDVGALTNCIVLDKNNIMLSSQYQGLIRYDLKARNYIVELNQGKYFPEISHLKNYRGKIWISSSNGLYTWKTSNKDVIYYSKIDGLPSNIIYNIEEKDGYLYLATHAGLCIFNPNFNQTHFNVPKVDIIGLYGIDGSFNYDVDLNRNSEINLQEKQNSFKIKFTVLDFNLPEKNIYKYRLLPIESDYSPFVTLNEAIYNGLPIGDYEFQVIGSNSDGMQNFEPVTMKIHIVPPFYKSKWFYVLGGLSLLVLLSFIILYRIRINKQSTEKLERVIFERTNEIEQKQKELSESSSKTNSLINNTKDCLLLLDKDGCVVLVNETFKQLYAKIGMDVKQGELFIPQLPPLFRDRFVSSINKLKTDTSAEHEDVFDVDNSRFYYITSLNTIYAEDGSIIGYTIFSKDYTAIKTVQQELTQLSLVASKTDSAIIITDEQGKIEWVNKSFERLSGYSLMEVVGKKPGHILQGPRSNQETIKFIREKLLEQVAFTAEIINYSKSGNEYWLILNISPVYDDKKVLKNFIAVQQNITERKQLEGELLLQRNELQQTNKELIDSINYAERIQKAILVGEQALRINLPESFIYFQPKDRVSGDFYWIGREGNYLVIVAADCTGHGVPGAMLSMIGTSLLNKIVYEDNCYLPGELMKRLNTLFYRQLNLKDTPLRDGMDASALTIDFEQNKMYFCGARNSGFMISNSEITELKAQRDSVGENEYIDFVSLEIPYQKGNMYYLFSDGFKDQFGGPEEKKLTSKRFREILFNASSMPINVQQHFIAEKLNLWRGGLQQTDDLLVIGLKL